eukprot:6184309-Pleurochrysis_carterae.AAC.5
MQTTRVRRCHVPSNRMLAGAVTLQGVSHRVASQQGCQLFQSSTMQAQNYFYKSRYDDFALYRLLKPSISRSASGHHRRQMSVVTTHKPKFRIEVYARVLFGNYEIEVPYTE